MIHKCLFSLILAFPLICRSQRSDYSKADIKSNSIREVTEIKITYNGSKNDSIIEYQGIYDSTGNLLEERKEFNKNGTLYISKKYLYSNKNDTSITVIKSVNPYTFLQESYRADRIEKKTEKYDLGLLMWTEIKFSSGIIELHQYSYNNKNMLAEETISKNDVLEIKYLVEYN